jgi:hypothetical protein
MIGRMLNALIRRAAEGDWEALEALAEVERLAPAAMTAGLTVARMTPALDGKPTGPGYSLAELSKVVGVTRSAVSQRTAAQHHKGTPRDCGHALCVGMKRCRTTTHN